MDTQSYLEAMYEALDELRGLDASEEFDNAVALGAYSRYVSRLESLTPPVHLTDTHRAIVDACGVMLRLLWDPAAQERLNAGIRNEELETAAQSGASATHRIQAEADALGLNLWFV